jgi:hypothetical protein
LLTGTPARKDKRAGMSGSRAWGGVFCEGDVADVVQRLDAPVAADQVGQEGRAGLEVGQAGQPIHRHIAPPATAQPADPAGDVKGLGGMGKPQAAAVGTVAGTVGHRDVGPGQSLELVVKAG